MPTVLLTVYVQTPPTDQISLAGCGEGCRGSGRIIDCEDRGGNPSRASIPKLPNPAAMKTRYVANIATSSTASASPRPRWACDMRTAPGYANGVSSRSPFRPIFALTLSLYKRGRPLGRGGTRQRADAEQALGGHGGGSGGHGGIIASGHAARWVAPKAIHPRDGLKPFYHLVGNALA